MRAENHFLKSIVSFWVIVFFITGCGQTYFGNPKRDSGKEEEPEVVPVFKGETSINLLQELNLEPNQVIEEVTILQGKTLQRSINKSTLEKNNQIIKFEGLGDGTFEIVIKILNAYNKDLTWRILIIEIKKSKGVSKNLDPEILKKDPIVEAKVKDKDTVPNSETKPLTENDEKSVLPADFTSNMNRYGATNQTVPYARWKTQYTWDSEFGSILLTENVPSFSFNLSVDFNVNSTQLSVATFANTRFEPNKEIFPSTTYIGKCSEEGKIPLILEGQSLETSLDANGEFKKTQISKLINVNYNYSQIFVYQGKEYCLDFELQPQVTILRSATEVQDELIRGYLVIEVSEDRFQSKTYFQARISLANESLHALTSAYLLQQKCNEYNLNAGDSGWPPDGAFQRDYQLTINSAIKEEPAMKHQFDTIFESYPSSVVIRVGEERYCRDFQYPD